MQPRQNMDKDSEDRKNAQKKTLRGEKKHCFNCGLPDHLGKDCPTKESSPKCFKCSKRLHIIRHYRLPNQTARLIEFLCYNYNYDYRKQLRPL